MEVAVAVSGQNKAQNNKLFQTFLNACYHMQLNRLGSDSSFSPYMGTLPLDELTMSIYWPQSIMVKVDSRTLIEEYRRAASMHNYIAKEFSSIPITNFTPQEWIWAMHISGSRVALLENTDSAYQNDENYQSFISPIAEYL